MPEQDEAEKQPGQPPDDANPTDAFTLPVEEGEVNRSAEVVDDPPAIAPEEATETAGSEEAEEKLAADQPVAADFSSPSPESSGWTDEPEDMAQLEPPAETAAHSPDAVPVEPLEPIETPLPVKEPRRLSRGEREVYERMRRRFAACGRCGYFLGDLQIYLGEEALQSASLASRDTWLRLDGDSTFRRLLSHAYGVELDIDYDYYDGCCPECRRRFIFADRGDELTRLKIRV